MSVLDDSNRSALSGLGFRAPLDRRQLLRLIGAVAAVGATGAEAACSSGLPVTADEVPTGRTVPIGLVVPAVGPFAKIGDDIQKGFKLFLSDNDNLLGLNTVDLRTAEEGASPATAGAAVKGLLDHGVIAVAGIASSSSLTAVASPVVAAQIPLITPCTAPTSLAGVSFVWRTGSVEGEAGQALAPKAGNSVFMMYEDTPYARQEVDGFKKYYKGHVVGEVGGASTNKSTWANRLQQARSAGADVIFAAYTGADAVGLLEAYRTANLSIRLMGPPSLTETSDLTKMTDPPRNVYTDSYYAADLDNESNRRFVSSYFKTYGVQPSGYAMAAYDSASVLDKALRLVKGTPSGAELDKAMALIGQIESPRGLWTFNTKRAPQQRWYLRQLRLDGMVAANLLDTDLQVLS